ncbi:MAG: hypothetical protein KAY32_10120 [Candidatus Eisenbacteria sp.]|nr:hypothetical protein [Candidatus Eisenbacteria bacterium]
MQTRISPRVVLAVLILLYAGVALRAAWVCDDAYISLRTVDNFVHGYGLTWNPPERVQAYTHPLWLFLMIPFYAVTGEAFHTTILLGLALSVLAVVWLGRKSASSFGMAMLAVGALALSKAFGDYSTAGLENPLTHLLLVIFLARYFREGNRTPRDLFALSLLTALAALTRLDTLLFYLPPLLVALVEAVRSQSPSHGTDLHSHNTRPRLRVLGALAAGMAPLILWELFSLFYYGFPFPNTAYAKLNTGIPAGALAAQGLHYFWHTIRFDPVTMLLILGGLLAPLITRQRRHWPVVAGILLYLLYILRIGGDFMGGRFFTAPLFVAVVLLVRISRPRIGYLVPAGIVLLAVGLAPRLAPLLQSPAERAQRTLIHADGIADEQAYYATEGYTLFKPKRVPGKPKIFGEDQGRALRDQGASVVLEGAVGILGFHAGPNVHIVDNYGLADPLLARLPALTFDPSAAVHKPHDNNWRIGHFLRTIPQGYLQTLMSGRNNMRDERLGAYHEKLALVTGGPLWSGARLAEIWRFNTGAYRDAFDPRRYTEPVRIPLAHLAAGPEEDDAGRTARALRVSFNGLHVALPGTTHAPLLQVRLDGHDKYLVVYYQDEDIVAVQPLAPRMPDAPTLIRAGVEVPPQAIRQGYDRLGFFPMRGDGFCAVGSIRLIDQP